MCLVSAQGFVGLIVAISHVAQAGPTNAQTSPPIAALGVVPVALIVLCTAWIMRSRELAPGVSSTKVYAACTAVFLVAEYASCVALALSPPACDDADCISSTSLDAEPTVADEQRMWVVWGSPVSALVFRPPLPYYPLSSRSNQPLDCHALRRPWRVCALCAAPTRPLACVPCSVRALGHDRHRCPRRAAPRPARRRTNRVCVDAWMPYCRDCCGPVPRRSDACSFRLATGAPFGSYGREAPTRRPLPPHRCALVACREARAASRRRVRSCTIL